MWLRGASALALLGLLGCADTEKADYQYDVDLRWTSYGIPHVKANDWGSLGYGFAYATATAVSYTHLTLPTTMLV